MPGIIQKIRDGGQSFDLDVKKGAQACKLRLERRTPVGSGNQAGQMAVWSDEVPTSLQAKQLHAELSQVTKAIQGQVDWSESAGQDMVSRAGAVTVRKMVETTKALLQGLEGALILRAGFIAGCFHMWRCETTLSRAGRLYQEEFLRHHNEWGSHLEQTRGHYESELQRLQRIAGERKAKFGRQQEMVMDKWLKGDKVGLLTEVSRLWSQYAQTQKGIKSRREKTELMVNEWYQGKAKGAMTSGFHAWRNLAVHEKMLRKQQQELGGTLASKEAQFAEECARRDAEFQEKMKLIERKNRDRTSNIQVVIAKWEKGTAQGLAMAAMTAWNKRAKMSRQRENLQMQMRKWAEGNDAGLKHTCFLNWKHLTQDGLNAKDSNHQRSEVERLEKMLGDQGKAHKDLQQLQMSEQEKKKREAEVVVATILKKWEMGAKQGLLKEVVQLWGKHIVETKKSGRKRQAVHDALLKSFEGDKRAAKHISFLNWKELAKSEKHVRELEKAQGVSDQRLHKFLEDADAQKEADQNSAAVLMAKAHEAAQLTVRKWIQGNTKGLMSMVFLEWKNFKTAQADRGRKHQAVKDSMLRFIEGEVRGAKTSAFMSWHSEFKQAKVARSAQGEAGSRIEQLEKKMAAMMDKQAKSMAKYAEMIGSKQGPVLTMMTFAAWKAQAGGLKQEFEVEREKVVAVEAMERQRHMHDTLKKERQARTLEAMGCKRSIVVCACIFEAWAYLWEKTQDERDNKLNHNKAMLQYSEFVIGQKLKKDDASLLASSFTEWHREGKLSNHQLDNDSMRRQLAEAVGCISVLEQQKMELQEQVKIYFQQIDSITVSLQRELRSKEELAIELQNAYRMQHQKASITPSRSVFTPRERTGLPMLEQGWSRTSSEQTLHEEPRSQALATAPSVVFVPPPPMPPPPSMPQLSFGRARSLGRRVEEGMVCAYKEASEESKEDRQRSRGASGASSRAASQGPTQADNLYTAGDRDNDGYDAYADLKPMGRRR